MYSFGALRFTAPSFIPPPPPRRRRESDASSNASDVPDRDIFLGGYDYGMQGEYDYGIPPEGDDYGMPPEGYGFKMPPQGEILEAGGKGEVPVVNMEALSEGLREEMMHTPPPRPARPALPEPRQPLALPPIPGPQQPPTLPSIPETQQPPALPPALPPIPQRPKPLLPPLPPLLRDRMPPIPPSPYPNRPPPPESEEFDPSEAVFALYPVIFPYVKRTVVKEVLDRVNAMNLAFLHAVMYEVVYRGAPGEHDYRVQQVEAAWESALISKRFTTACGLLIQQEIIARCDDGVDVDIDTHLGWLITHSRKYNIGEAIMYIHPGPREHHLQYYAPGEPPEDEEGPAGRITLGRPPPVPAAPPTSRVQSPPLPALPAPPAPQPAQPVLPAGPLEPLPRGSPLPAPVPTRITAIGPSILAAAFPPPSPVEAPAPEDAPPAPEDETATSEGVIPGPIKEMIKQFAALRLPGRRPKPPPRDPVQPLQKGPYPEIKEDPLRDKRIQKDTERLKKYFEKEGTYFKFLGFVGRGATNMACRVKWRNRWWNPYPSETFIIKRAFMPLQAESLRREKRTLRRLRGAMHMVQLYSPRRPIQLDNMVLMEDLSNGSLTDFLNRRIKEDLRELPNRLLYRIFLCLVRSCIAMAYPPHGPRDGPLRVEEIPEDPKDQMEVTQLIHCDMHTSNILFGDLTPDHWEHELVPIMKLIDFERAGFGRDPANRNPGVKYNIFDIGDVMTRVIGGTAIKSGELWKEQFDVGGVLREVITYSHFEPASRFPNLDPELRRLVLLCCAYNPEFRPSLPDLAREVHDAVLNKTPMSYIGYPRELHETDDRIRRILSDMIFNAPDGTKPDAAGDAGAAGAAGA
ncbi:hypothetical protein F4776DRAFT_645852 [Hypoxylon sp. NC0597]|nr:hypothetical protein F4776DRAFT_645852 [Hypoxylon sp. NC0597]